MQTENREFNASGVITQLTHVHSKSPRLAFAKSAARRHNILKERLIQAAWNRDRLMAEKLSRLASHTEARNRVAYWALIRLLPACPDCLTDDADFVVWEGTHLKGRQQIASFTQQIFDMVVKGSHLEGEVKFVRLLSPVLAVMHSVVRMALPGQIKTSPSRDSMELTVVTKRDGEWRAEGLLNARRLTMERQVFLDELDSLPADAQQQVSDLVASLKQHHR